MFAAAPAPSPPAQTPPSLFQQLQAALERAGDALETWIRTSRATALTQGVAPIPADLKAELKGFFPEARLDKVRFRVGGEQDWSLQGNLLAMPSTKAITLDDVIVFRDDKTARDLRIWAHELAHVEQYERWGIDGFARRYLVDFRTIEADAWTVADRFEAWRRARDAEHQATR